MKRGVAIKRGSVVSCHVRAMLYIRRRMYVSRRAEDEERRPDSQVIVRGNHGRVTAFCLKSVTKRAVALLTLTDGDRKKEEIEGRKRERD
jgi:hypothetical protein